MGITEYDFWNMTYAELERALDSKRRVRERESQERATYDYILANLIGHSVSRVFNSDNKYPEIYEAYPTIFEKDAIEAKKQERTMELSAQRFMAFAESFNEKIAKKEAKDKA